MVGSIGFSSSIDVSMYAASCISWRRNFRYELSKEMWFSPRRRLVERVVSCDWVMSDIAYISEQFMKEFGTPLASFAFCFVICIMALLIVLSWWSFR